MSNQEGARPEAAGEQKIRYQNPILVGVVLLFAGISVAMIQYKVPTIMTSLMAEFSMNAEAASWLMSIFTLMSIFFAIPAGTLAQRYGAKRMMIVASGIAIVGSIIGLLSGTSAVLIASRAIEGIALTILTTCGPIIVQQNVRPEKIGTTMGVWGIWGCLGSTIAAVLTPTIFETMGFSGLWIAYAVVAAVAAAVVLFVIKDRGLNLSEALEASAEASAQAAKPRYSEIISKDVILFFIGFAIFNICLLAILAFVPTILQMQNFDPTLSGFISTAPMLLSIISSPLFGVISDKIGRVKPLLALAMLVMGPCTFLLYTNTGALLWVAVVIMGLIGMGGVGMFLSGFAKLLPRPELASIGMGVMVTVQGLGQFLGTFLVQGLLGADLTNWFFAGAVLMVLGFVGTAALMLTKMK
ncbi:MAG: MFS transporter [Eggerthellaceae bacterium]|nr:MFS transporter [Eggerthellaceae bacterium]